MATVSETREFFQTVQKYPKMYGSGPTFREAKAFLCGYDAAHEYLPLDGFNYWLAHRVVGSGPNLAWFALVLRVAFPDEERPGCATDRPPEEESVAVATLYRLLDQFLAVRESGRSAEQIRAECQAWMAERLSRRETGEDR